MKPHTATIPQHTATHPTWPPARRTVYAVCPECGNPGPHRDSGGDTVECGNHYRTRTGPSAWRACGATWQLPVVGFVPENGLVDRIVTILDKSDIAVVDASNGATLLTWECTLNIARAIVTDPGLVALVPAHQDKLLGGADTIAVFVMPIEDLDLTVRSHNCLKRVGINTVGELVSRSEADLLDIRNFGTKSFHEVKLKLTGLGLQLKNSPPVPFDPSVVAAAVREAAEESPADRVVTLDELGGAA